MVIMLTLQIILTQILQSIVLLTYWLELLILMALQPLMRLSIFQDRLQLLMSISMLFLIVQIRLILVLVSPIILPLHLQQM